MSAESVQRLQRELHDLCQPLATLQCRLEYAQMMGDDAAFRNAVDGALEDCGEISAAVTAMRACMAAMDTAAVDTERMAVRA